MKNYWFSKSHSRWYGITMLLAGYALGGQHVWWWLGILVVGAAIEGFMESR